MSHIALVVVGVIVRTLHVGVLVRESRLQVGFIVRVSLLCLGFTDDSQGVVWLES